MQCRDQIAENRLFDRGLSNKVSMKRNERKIHKAEGGAGQYIQGVHVRVVNVILGNLHGINGVMRERGTERFILRQHGPVLVGFLFSYSFVTRP